MIISVAVSKGGVGKTVSAATISSILATAGYKVLAVDLDVQGNLTDILAQEYTPPADELVLDFIAGEGSGCDKLVAPGKLDNLLVIPATPFLEDTSYQLAKDFESDATSLGRFRKNLRNLQHSGGFDYVVIDSSPNTTVLTRALLLASDKVIMPVEADNLSFKGLSNLIETIISLSSQFGTDTQIGGVFLTRADVRTTRFKQLYQGYSDYYGSIFIPVYIRRSEAVQQSTTLFEPLITFDKKCPALADYVELVNYLGLLDNSHYRRLLSELKM